MNVGWPANPRWNVDQSTSLYFSIFSLFLFLLFFPTPAPNCWTPLLRSVAAVQCKMNIRRPVVVKNLWCKLIPRFVLILLVSCFQFSWIRTFPSSIQSSRKLGNHLLLHFTVCILINHFFVFYNTSHTNTKYNSNIQLWEWFSIKHHIYSYFHRIIRIIIIQQVPEIIKFQNHLPNQNDNRTIL